jgi:glyoxylase-like metal-dependent hydrolase (beta-lactamase superfamily II)
MALKQLAPGAYLVPLGFVNAFLLEGGDGLVLIDTGIPGSADKIFAAVRELGKQPADIRHIVLTHLHADHTGSLAALKLATGAPAYMHPLDAALVRQGQAMRPMMPAPGLLPALIYRLLLSRRRTPSIVPAEIEHELADGDMLDFAGGLRAIHAPGHSAGQLAFLWPQQGGLLFAADACGNMLGLNLSVIYEDLAVGLASLARLGELDYQRAAFGHGGPILSAASQRVRAKWGRAAS